MRRMASIGAAVAAGILVASPALAGGPVALVEDVTGTPTGVVSMDYLAAGKVIRLGPKDGLVVDYLGSCERETISGGIVTIGTEESSIAGGKVRREKVQCDGGKLNLTTEQASQSGTVVFRAAPGKPAEGVVAKTLYGLCPLVDLEGGGRLVIERLDQRGDRIELDIAAARLLRGTFYDFAKDGRSLVPGGVYRASANGRSIVFRIDPDARPGESPLAGRLLRL
jgi:hypothetical protein